jgi:hypothetical protein
MNSQKSARVSYIIFNIYLEEVTKPVVQKQPVKEKPVDEDALNDFLNA